MDVGCVFYFWRVQRWFVESPRSNFLSIDAFEIVLNIEVATRKKGSIFVLRE